MVVSSNRDDESRRSDESHIVEVMKFSRASGLRDGPRCNKRLLAWRINI